MSDFNLAIPVILAHEGGFSQDPHDPGGATKYGISTRFLQDEGITAAELGLSDLSPASIRQLKLDVAKNLYKKYFWERYQYGQISDQSIATKCLDVCVNLGPRANKMAQRAATASGHPATDDGVLGPKSFAAINACEPQIWLQAMVDEQMAYYLAIVAKNPGLRVFLRGWTKRAHWAG